MDYGNYFVTIFVILKCTNMYNILYYWSFLPVKCMMSFVYCSEFSAHKHSYVRFNNQYRSLRPCLDNRISRGKTGNSDQKELVLFVRLEHGNETKEYCSNPMKMEKFMGIKTSTLTSFFLSFASNETNK